ncbi:uncharacterized protein DUF2285 [Hephaestia caeni]|uniref:Uncharacterized protein DUF2285 n=2 Tax=Alphaproteobacteria TaxID=28211 RepID=A0A397NIN2_9SPHN|nr:uncharacterized protein DUF2285 [Hephaestia caeni]
MHIQAVRPEMTVYPLDPDELLAAGIVHRGVASQDASIIGPNALHRLWLDGYDTGTMAVTLPLDLVYDDRAAAAMRLWRTLKGLKPGSEPMPLSDYARGQLILAIRLLDAEHSGATEREMAQAILKTSARDRRTWLATEHRSRLRRLLAKARALLAGGYFQLLSPPPRRPRRKP